MYARKVDGATLYPPLPAEWLLYAYETKIGTNQITGRELSTLDPNQAFALFSNELPNDFLTKSETEFTRTDPKTGVVFTIWQSKQHSTRSLHLRTPRLIPLHHLPSTESKQWVAEAKTLIRALIVDGRAGLWPTLQPIAEISYSGDRLIYHSEELRKRSVATAAAPSAPEWKGCADTGFSPSVFMTARGWTVYDPELRQIIESARIERDQRWSVQVVNSCGGGGGGGIPMVVAQLIVVYVLPPIAVALPVQSIHDHSF